VRRAGWLIAPVAISIFSGCVAPIATRSRDSYAADVPGIDATQLAQATSNSLATLYPPANTTMVVDPSHTDSKFGAGLTTALSKAGFAVADPASASHLDSASAHRLRYRVSSFDTQALVELDLDDRQITQLYAADTSGLVAAASAPTVRDK
jgi:hypothetical protein